jgi:hypothetical protein
MWVDVAGGQVQVGSYQSFATVHARRQGHRRDEAPTAPQLPGVPTHSAGHRTVVEGGLPLISTCQGHPEEAVLKR